MTHQIKKLARTFCASRTGLTRAELAPSRSSTSPRFTLRPRSTSILILLLLQILLLILLRKLLLLLDGLSSASRHTPSDTCEPSVFILQLFSGTFFPRSGRRWVMLASGGFASRAQSVEIDDGSGGRGAGSDWTRGLAEDKDCLHI